MVSRFPGQHRERPHCPKCQADLPTFRDSYINVAGDLDGAELLGVTITYHVRCKCGAEWDLRRTAK